MNTYTAVARKVDGWWIGWIKEIPGVNCQEKTRVELLDSLKETIGELMDLRQAKKEEKNEPTVSLEDVKSQFKIA